MTTFPDADAVLPGLAGDPTQFSGITATSNSFDFGLPFFFGRQVYTSIDSSSAGAYFALGASARSRRREGSRPALGTSAVGLARTSGGARSELGFLGTQAP